MSDRVIRWGGVAGIVFVILVLITIFSGGSPPAGDDSIAEIRDYMVDHRRALLIGNTIGLLAVPFVIWFFVVLREVLRGDQTDNALGTAMLSGVLLTAALALAGGGVSVAAVYVDGGAERLAGGSVRIVFEAQNLLFGATAAGIVLLSIAAATAIRRTGALPMFTMWLALLATLGNLVAMAGTLDAKVATIGFFGIGTFALFVLVTGITMALGKVTPRGAAAPATA